MKKIEFEKLSEQDLFTSFNANKLNPLTSTTLRGGTSTTLCKTNEPLLDPDSESNQENPSDRRCLGY